MKKQNIYILICILFYAVSLNGSFEHIQRDAKLSGRAKSLTAGIDDNACLVLNPASIASISTYYLSCNYWPGLNGLDQGDLDNISLNTVFPQIGNLPYGYVGAGYYYFSADFYYERLIQILYANKYKKLYFGLSINNYQLGVDKRESNKYDPLFKNGDYNQIGWGLHTGLIYMINSKLYLGLSGKNIVSTDMAGSADEQAGKEFRLGGYYLVNTGKNRSNLSLDMAFQNSLVSVGMSGEKWFFSDHFALRMGLSTESIHLGTGLRWKYIVLNYAWELWLYTPGIHQQYLGCEIFF